MTDRPPNQNPPSTSRLSRLFGTLRFCLYTLIASVSLLLFKTLDFLSMDLLFPVDDDDADFVDRWPHTPSSSSSHHLDTDHEEEQLYFVPYRWWSEASESLFGYNMSAVTGDLYATESSGAYLEPMGIWGYDMKAEIVLNMRRVHSSTNKLKSLDCTEGGDYALIAEWMFLRALKRTMKVQLSVKPVIFFV